ncbi:hypothetical protein ACFL0U_02460 [Pseudomonadota bacterium]
MEIDGKAMGKVEKGHIEEGYGWQEWKEQQNMFSHDHLKEKIEVNKK